jgi:phosphatidylglycerol---prolipoprotein diacylglyceryl transferase
MNPILAQFNVGDNSVVLQAYSTFYVLACIVAVASGTVIAWRRGASWWRALATFGGALAVGIVGARLFDLGIAWRYYAEDPSRIYALQFRGFSLYGGLILALAAGAVLSRALHLPLWRLADGAVPALTAGIVLMRTGCFLNGCCFGTVTSLPWGVTYPVGSPAWVQQLATGKTGLLGFAGAIKPVHPTQIYEMIAALALCGLTMWLLLRRKSFRARRTPSGVPFLVFALGFTLFRFGDNYLRVRLPTIAAPVWFYPVLYLTISAGVAGLIVWRLRHGSPAAAQDASSPGEGSPTGILSNTK